MTKFCLPSRNSDTTQSMTGNGHKYLNIQGWRWLKLKWKLEEGQQELKCGSEIEIFCKGWSDV